MSLCPVHHWAVVSQFPWSFFCCWFICRCLSCCPSLDPGLAELWLPSFHHCMLGPWFCIPSQELIPIYILCVFEICQNFPVHLCQPFTVLAQLSVHWNGLSLCFEEGVLEDQPSVLGSLCRPCLVGSCQVKPWASHSPLSCKVVIPLLVLHTGQYLKLHQFLDAAAKITSSLQLPDEFFLVRQWQVQQSAFPSWLIDHLCEEMVGCVPEISWTACSQPCCLSTRYWGG